MVYCSISYLIIHNVSAVYFHCIVPYFSAQPDPINSQQKKRLIVVFYCYLFGISYIGMAFCTNSMIFDRKQQTKKICLYSFAVSIMYNDVLFISKDFSTAVIFSGACVCIFRKREREYECVCVCVWKHLIHA